MDIGDVFISVNSKEILKSSRMPDKFRCLVVERSNVVELSIRDGTCPTVEYVDR
jgi:hypothetical protein